jgi:hypothetical protein
VSRQQRKKDLNPGTPLQLSWLFRLSVVHDGMSKD